MMSKKISCVRSQVKLHFLLLLKSTTTTNKRNKNTKKQKLHLQWNKEKVQPQAVKHIHQTAEFGTKRGGRLRTSSYLQQNAGFLKIKYPSPGKASMNLWWEWQDVRMRTSHGRTGCVQQRPISTAGGKGGEEAKREAALAFHLIYGHASILWRLQSKALDEWGIHPQPTTQRNLGTEWTEMLDLARGYLSHKSHKTWPAVQNRWVHNPSFSRPQSSAHYSLANIWFNKKQTNKNQR